MTFLRVIAGRVKKQNSKSTDTARAHQLRYEVPPLLPFASRLFLEIDG